MIFSKKQLGFLELYSACADSDSNKSVGNTVRIKAEKDIVYFTQYAEEIKLITSFPNKTEEEFEVAYETSQLFRLVNVCREGDLINIEEDNVIFGKNSKYTLRPFYFDVTPPRVYLDILEKQYEAKYEITNLKKINSIKNFIGQDVFNTISLQDNYFISYNEFILGVSKTENNIDDILYFPAAFLNIIRSLNLDGMTINKLEGGGFYGFTINDVNIFVDIKHYEIPYIFDDNLKNLYDHKHTVTINKKEFIDVFQRIKILTSGNNLSRIFITFEKGQISLESRDSQKGHEVIPAQVDPSLEGFSIILSSNLLSSIISSLKGKEIHLYLENDESLEAIKISDEINKDYFVHMLLEFLEMED